MTDKYESLRAALDLAAKGMNVTMGGGCAFFDVETIRALLGERDALRDALQKVRPVIAADRQALLDTHGDGSEIPSADELGTLGLYEYDGALHVIDAALAQHQGEKHGDHQV